MTTRNASYAALMRRLEAVEISTSDLNEELRLDPQYFSKRYLHEDARRAHYQNVLLGEEAGITDGPHGYHQVDEASEIAMLTAKCAKGWFAERRGAETISIATHDANLRSALETDDLILSTRGTVGLCAIVRPEVLPSNIDQDVARITLKQNSTLLPRYLLAYLNSSYGQDWIQRNSAGMVQQGLSLGKVRKLPVPSLSRSFQRDISHVIDLAEEQRGTSEKLFEAAESMILEALGAPFWSMSAPRSYVASSADVKRAQRFDAQYFNPVKIHVLKELARLPGRPLKDCVSHVKVVLDPKGGGMPPVVRNFDLPDALYPVLSDEKKVSAPSEIGSNKKLFQPGDVVISRLRAYLREIAIVRTSPAVQAIGSTEFLVLRPLAGLSPELLWAYLRSVPVQAILRWCVDGSQHPRFSEDDLLGIPLPDATLSVSAEVERLFKNASECATRSRLLLDRARRAVEIAIETSEAAAGAYLAEGF